MILLSVQLKCYSSVSLLYFRCFFVVRCCCFPLHELFLVSCTHFALLFTIAHIFRLHYSPIIYIKFSVASFYFFFWITWVFIIFGLWILHTENVEKPIVAYISMTICCSRMRKNRKKKPYKMSEIKKTKK